MTEETSFPGSSLPHSSKPFGEDFASIGIALKAKREELSYTIEHVADITRITLSNLRAIEDGAMDKLPGLVFVRGFVRNYANLLGMDSDWMSEVLNRAYNHVGDRADAPLPTAGPRFDTSKLNMTHLGLAAGAFVLVLLIGFFASNSGPESSGSQEVVQAVEKTETAGPVAAPVQPLSLVLVAKSTGWVSVTADNQRVKEMLLEKDKKYEFPAKEGYQLIMSTGGTALIQLNGKTLEVPQDQQNMLFQTKLTKDSLTSTKL